jgi:diguanylate cyclase (GGDEF)-like protein
MKIEDLPEDFSILLYQGHQSRVKQIKSILVTFSLILSLLLLNDIAFLGGKQIIAYVSALIVMVGLFSFVTSDTTSIVSGMLLWTLLLFACYMAWRNDGLFDTAIVAFPCILIFAFMLGGVSLLLPLVCFMVGTFYFLAYAAEQGILIKSSLVDGPLWVKAHNLSIILVLYCTSIFIIYRYINSLLNRLQDESYKTWQFKKEAELQLQQDNLTNLPNELVCKNELEDILSKGEIKDEIIGVATLDLKNFEWVDSSLGHEIGERVICLVSERLKKLMDKKKKLYRITGNEFMILIIESDYEAISEFCQQILQTINRPFQVENYEIDIEAGIGVATAPFDGSDYGTLRQKSHTALYKAKLDEEQHLKFFEAEMEHSINRRVKAVQELKKALTQDEFELFYQPKVDLTTNTFIGAEALIRWNKPGIGYISPFDFIPTAEESGVINEIGKWALEQACKDCKAWHDLGSPLSIAVNLSPVQFRRGNLPSTVFRALNKVGLDASFLELEITESLFIGDADNTKDQIHQLSNHGISIAIDDFGTGYSNLNYLSKFNASTLKIDMSFVRKMMDSEQHFHIVDAVIRMAQAMELECVAEGVENEAIAVELHKLGCHYGQGYLWSKPLPENEFRKLLVSAN